ncbi:tRNA-intron endonuclease [Methanohalophilus levihalophilus]|uniref:tRNA-intron lyase n=1 Tax=Methanohalophilus levihalophilus TaxID=1431282 RepID=UPI001AEB4F0B|nr:tRNA-intron lyase [Methanohalophilus levihalophilus]MBP2029168.1 tRNA-intron endonuclease [Methanohalophilus levihalophilus]
MIGKIEKDRVVAGKSAIEELYKKGFHGRPKDNKLELTLIEAAYLLYREKLEIGESGKKLAFRDFFKKAATIEPAFELKYIVYKDLKERGYYVQPSAVDFRVYPRGSNPGSGPAKILVYVQSERVPLKIKELLQSLKTAENMRKQLVLAVVDEESDITYYEVKSSKLHGGMEEPHPSLTTDATFLEDRVIIWKKSASEILLNNGFYGKPLDQERLQLSLVEGGYLLSEEVLKIHSMESDEILGIDAFVEKASSIEKDFSLKFAAYSDLRNLGFVPKTGFKFGTHFRVYKEVKSLEKLPHSEFLIHAIPNNYEFSLPVMSRAIRLSNSVRKRMIFAVEKGEQINYIDIGRKKM